MCVVTIENIRFNGVHGMYNRITTEVTAQVLQLYLCLLINDTVIMCD